MSKRKTSNLIDLPSRTELERRLASILTEAKRLRLLIRTAKELDQIVGSSSSHQGAKDE